MNKIIENEPNKTVVNRGPDGRFLPGNNANPQGRPRNELCLTSLAREKLGQVCPYAPDKTWAEYLVDRWLGQAVENATYFRELIERLEGKVLQPIGGENGNPIEVSVDYRGKIISAISRHASANGERKDDSKPQ